MSPWFLVIAILFVLVSAIMVLIILVQRPQGGGLAGAFGGAGGAGTETVFGGRVGDALTYATVIAFVVYLCFAIALNLLDTAGPPPAAEPPVAAAATPVTQDTAAAQTKKAAGPTRIKAEAVQGEDGNVTLKMVPPGAEDDKDAGDGATP